VDNMSLYFGQKNKEETPPFFCPQDPYWQELLQKNYRRQHRWKTPSILAWDHKQYGLVGEVLDCQQLEENFLKAQRDLTL